METAVDLKELVLILCINARFGLSTAELQSFLIIRQEGETESAHMSLTLLAKVKARGSAVLKDRNLREIWASSWDP